MKSPCRHFRTCSGCNSLNIPYPKQLRDKGLLVRKALDGLPETAFLPVTPSPSPFGYRSSTKLCLDEDNFGRKRIGLYQQQSKTVVDIPDCPVHDPTINKLVARVFPTGSQASGGLPAAFYQHGKRGFQSGKFKFVTIRTSPEYQAAGVIISHTGIEEDSLRNWAKTHAGSNISLYASLLTKADDTRVLSDKISHMSGPLRLPFKIGDLRFELGPTAFFQANRTLVPEFIRHITDDLSGATLLDLYGGFGAYSYAVAKRFMKIYLVDGNADAIDAAGSQPNTPDVLRPVHASVEDFLARHQGLRQDKTSVSHIIVNPPRAGISSKVSSELAASRSMTNLCHLTYVSCNPQTLARDIKILLKSGRWKVDKIRPFDMFPQTEHVEVVVTLKRS